MVRGCDTRLSLRRLGRLVLLVVLAWAPAVSAADGAQLLKRARDAFEYGDFARAAQTLGGQATRARFPLESDRVEAYRLLGLSYFYLSKKTPSDAKLKAQAQEAFFDLLKQNPDYELDPFYTPPEAVSFFDEVRRQNETYLEPIRRRRHARLREQQLEEEARIEAERRRREELQPPAPRTVVIERELERRSLLVAVMPFGLGQFQNDDTRTGLAFLTSEIVAAAVSVLSWTLIELMRDPASGRFSPELYGYATTLQDVKYWSAGAFYALWAAGAIHAGVNYDPVRLVREGTVDTPPSAAPNGPLFPTVLPQPEPLVPGTRPVSEPPLPAEPGADADAPAP